MAETPTHRPLLGISACLLGDPVRYDGDHRRDELILRRLGPAVSWLGVCPEVGIGLGVPRPTIRLVGPSRAPRLVGVADAGRDFTQPMQRFARRQLRQLSHAAGYIVKARSPSCGLGSTPIAGRRGTVATGSGLYTATLRAQMPALPMVEETALADPECFDQFVQQLFIRHRWLQAEANHDRRAALQGFHRRHRLVYACYGVRALARLDALAASPVLYGRGEGNGYLQAVMSLTARPAGRAGHARVLRGVVRSLAHTLDRADRNQLLGATEELRRGTTTRNSVISMVRHFVSRCSEETMQNEYYLFPDAMEFRLRFGI